MNLARVLARADTITVDDAGDGIMLGARETSERTDWQIADCLRDEEKKIGCKD